MLCVSPSESWGKFWCLYIKEKYLATAKSKLVVICSLSGLAGSLARYTPHPRTGPKINLGGDD